MAWESYNPYLVTRFMKTNDTRKKWLYAAYEEFAKNGPDFSLKALSQKTSLPRATFYYHFLNKDELISELLEFHCEIVLQFKEELKQIKSLVPDLYVLMHKFPVSVQFQQQLLKNIQIEKLYSIYAKSNSECIQLLLPHIKTHFGFHQPDEEVFRFYNTLTDAWYTRLDFSNFKVEKMINLAEEIAGNVLALHYKTKHTVNSFRR